MCEIRGRRFLNSCIRFAGKKEAIGTGISFALSQGILFWAYAASFYYGGYLIREGLMNNIDDVLKVFFAVIMSSMGNHQRPLPCHYDILNRILL